MDVVFESGQENRFTMQVEGYGKIWFDKGALVTQDKDLIKALYKHPLRERGEYELVTNEQRVVQYLEGEEPDKLTEEILDNITRQGIMELGEALGSSETQPTLIKLTLEGKPITDEVKEIIDFYQIDKTKEEVKKEVKREETAKVETVTNELSTDLKAKEAIDWIENHEIDQVKGFVPEDESRKTVRRAYESKIEE